MDWVAERGGVEEETRIPLLGNDLVAIVPGESEFSPHSARGLNAPSLRHLALAGENVPAGRYAQAALEAMGVWTEVEGLVVRAGTVRGALEWVARGEVEAGIVYLTDAVAEPRVKVAFTFPAETHPPIIYPVAILTRAPMRPAAMDFLAFCRSPAAARVFREAGFRPLQGDSADQVGMAGAGTGRTPPREVGLQEARPGSVDSRGPVLPDPWSAIRLSFLVALGATLVGFIPAVWLGWVLARKDFFGKSIISTIALIPLVLPPVVTGFLLLSLFGTQGPLGAWLADSGFPIPFTLVGATIAALTVGLPLYVISIRNAFQTVDPSYEEVAWTLGQRPGAAFRRVTFPLALPGIVAGAVLAFARALGEFGATVVLAGNIEGSTRTIPLAVYTLLESPEGREAIWLLVGASVLLSMMALLGFEALSRHQRRQMGGRRGH